MSTPFATNITIGPAERWWYYRWRHDFFLHKTYGAQTHIFLRPHDHRGRRLAMHCLHACAIMYTLKHAWPENEQQGREIDMYHEPLCAYRDLPVIFWTWLGPNGLPCGVSDDAGDDDNDNDTWGTRTRVSYIQIGIIYVTNSRERSSGVIERRQGWRFFHSVYYSVAGNWPNGVDDIKRFDCERWFPIPSIRVDVRISIV